jgi:Predicted membrane protein (DUF2232)
MKHASHISWPYAMFVSCAASAASVLLCIGMRPQSVFGALLFLLSPLPLIIAGLSYHALIAALAALIGCFALNLVQTSSLSIVYALVAGVPAWLVCSAATRRTQNYEQQQNTSSAFSAGAIILGIGCYVSLLVLVSTIFIVPNHENLSKYLSDMISKGFEAQGSMGNLELDAKLEAQANTLIPMFVRFLPHMSAVSFFVMIALSSYIGARITFMSGRLMHDWPDFRRLQLPFLSVYLFVAALLFSFLPSYFGLAGEIFSLIFSVCLMLQGLAVLHFIVANRPFLSWLILVSWSAIIIFGFFGLGFSVLGLADFIFDFRKLRKSISPSPNP